MYIGKNPPREKIATVPINDEWKDCLARKMWWQHENIFNRSADEPWAQRDIDQYQGLHNRLIAIGGEETCFAYPEEDIIKILERGNYYIAAPRAIRLIKGTECRCHSNSAELWQLNHNNHDIHIMTGYALTEDGMWRQHTALIHRYMTPSGQNRTRIVETTVKRLAYYGFELTDEEADEFVANAIY